MRGMREDPNYRDNVEKESAPEDLPGLSPQKSRLTVISSSVPSPMRTTSSRRGTSKTLPIEEQIMTRPSPLPDSFDSPEGLRKLGEGVHRRIIHGYADFNSFIPKRETSRQEETTTFANDDELVHIEQREDDDCSQNHRELHTLDVDSRDNVPQQQEQHDEREEGLDIIEYLKNKNSDTRLHSQKQESPDPPAEADLETTMEEECGHDDDVTREPSCDLASRQSSDANAWSLLDETSHAHAQDWNEDEHESRGTEVESTEYKQERLGSPVGSSEPEDCSSQDDGESSMNGDINYRCFVPNYALKKGRNAQADMVEQEEIVLPIKSDDLHSSLSEEASTASGEDEEEILEHDESGTMVEDNSIPHVITVSRNDHDTNNRSDQYNRILSSWGRKVSRLGAGVGLDMAQVDSLSSSDEEAEPNADKTSDSLFQYLFSPVKKKCENTETKKEEIKEAPVVDWMADIFSVSSEGSDADHSSSAYTERTTETKDDIIERALNSFMCAPNSQMNAGHVTAQDRDPIYQTFNNEESSLLLTEKRYSDGESEDQSATSEQEVHLKVAYMPAIDRGDSESGADRTTKTLNVVGITLKQSGSNKRKDLIAVSDDEESMKHAYTETVRQAGASNENQLGITKDISRDSRITSSIVCDVGNGTEIVACVKDDAYWTKDADKSDEAKIAALESTGPTPQLQPVGISQQQRRQSAGVSQQQQRRPRFRVIGKQFSKMLKPRRRKKALKKTDTSTTSGSVREIDSLSPNWNPESVAADGLKLFVEQAGNKGSNSTPSLSAADTLEISVKALNEDGAEIVLGGQTSPLRRGSTFTIEVAEGDNGTEVVVDEKASPSGGEGKKQIIFL